MLGIYILAVCLYIIIGFLFYSLGVVASEADKQMEQEFKNNCNYWRTTYNTGHKGDD